MVMLFRTKKMATTMIIIILRINRATKTLNTIVNVGVTTMILDVDESMRSGTRKNELHDVMFDSGEQQQPLNYVELTMSGKNDYYNTETESEVVINYGGDHDGVGEEGNVAGGLNASTSQYYDDDEDEQVDDNEEDAVDGIFIDDPDDDVTQVELFSTELSIW